MKAYLALHAKDISQVHDFVLLSQSCAKIDDDFGKFYKLCERLNDFGVKTRYPTRYELSEDDLNMALEIAGEILDSVTVRLAE